MPGEQIRDEIASHIRRARITVPADRLPALEMGLNGVRAASEAIHRHDLGLAEPACRFSAPPHLASPAMDPRD